VYGCRAAVAMELGPQSASEVRVGLDQRRRHCSSVACFGAEVEIWLAVDRPAGGGAFCSAIQFVVADGRLSG
jgi:hypothetical protein